MAERIAWRLEAAKQLWAGGQQALAVDSASSLLKDASDALGATAVNTSRIFCLVGSWLAESRCCRFCPALVQWSQHDAPETVVPQHLFGRIAHAAYPCCCNPCITWQQGGELGGCAEAPPAGGGPALRCGLSRCSSWSFSTQNSGLARIPRMCRTHTWLMRDW